MINLSLTVREALYILERCGNDDNLREKVVAAIEAVTTGEKTGTTVVITKGVHRDNLIRCIQIFRTLTGLGLHESKEWFDTVPNTIRLTTPARANDLLKDLVSLGCAGYIQ